MCNDDKMCELSNSNLFADNAVTYLSDEEDFEWLQQRNMN